MIALGVSLELRRKEVLHNGNIDFITRLFSFIDLQKVTVFSTKRKKNYFILLSLFL